MFATRQDFFIALNLRDWHARRLGRYSKSQLYKGETLKDVIRSLTIHDALTGIIGDGLFFQLRAEAQASLVEAGYVADRE